MKIFIRWLDAAYGFVDQICFNSLPVNINILQEYILYLRSDYAGSITNTTICSYVRPMKAFLRWCYEEGYSPDYLIRVKLPKPDAIPPVPLLQEEVDQMNACIDKTTLKGLRNYCMIHLMLDCGLRSQEVIRQDLL